MKIDIKSQKALLSLLYFYNYDLNEVHNSLNKFDYLEDVLESIRQDKKDLFEDNAEGDQNLINTFYKALDLANECLDKSHFLDIKIMTIFDKNYPEQFKELSDAPPVLFYKGKLNKIDLASIIGTRTPTKYGEKITKRVVSRLVAKNFGIVSGLAEGIDTLAHQFTLDNEGYTIAILPTPMDKLYPKSNYKLAGDIIKNGGCIVTEFPFGISKGKYSFIMRNRLVSKLSNCVIPIEMSKTSGTMHTINFAVKQNRRIISLKPTSDFIEESNKAIEGVLLVNERILNNEINGAVVRNEEELIEELTKCKIYHDRVFKFNTLVLFEQNSVDE